MLVKEATVLIFLFPAFQYSFTVLELVLFVHSEVHIDGSARSTVLEVVLFNHSEVHIKRLMQKRRNSIALAMELRLSCINPSI